MVVPTEIKMSSERVLRADLRELYPKRSAVFSETKCRFLGQRGLNLA